MKHSKLVKRVTPVLAGAITLSVLIANIASADEPIKIDVSVVSKIDVALAVGPTEVDYSAFEPDLREILQSPPGSAWRTYDIDSLVRTNNGVVGPPIAPEDLTVQTGKATQNTSESNFPWWQYDHTINTAPAARRGGNFTGSYLQWYEKLWYDGYTPLDAGGSPNLGSITNQPSDEELWGLGHLVDSYKAVDPVRYFELRPWTSIEDHKNHFYISSNAATAQYSDASVDNTNKISPDYGSTYHPFDGRLRHAELTHAGSQVDFYGYSSNGYKDFMYLPNMQATKKSFEFAIEENLAYDALDAVGFLFNTHVNGGAYGGTGPSTNFIQDDPLKPCYLNSETGLLESNLNTCAPQLMSGYLLALEYTSSGVGSQFAVYKFKDINTKTFHTASNPALKSTSGFTRVATAVYPSTDFTRKIRLDVTPTTLELFYAGTTSKYDAVAPESTASVEAKAVTNSKIEFEIDESNGKAKVDPSGKKITVGGFGEQRTFSNVVGDVLNNGFTLQLDRNHVEGFGYGPLVSYISHSCGRPTAISLLNLSLSVDTVRTLVEVVREPEWREDAQKYLVNLNEEEVEDFKSSSITGELLNRLRNDDIYYIGWATDYPITEGPNAGKSNSEASEEFLDKNDLKGIIVNMSEYPALDEGGYELQILEIAKEIYHRYYTKNVNDVVLTTDATVLNVEGADQVGTIDPEWPQGKWMVAHRLDNTGAPASHTGDEPFQNALGVHPESGQLLDSLDMVFYLPGYYDIYYKNAYVKTVTSHRPPVANFSVEVTPSAGQQNGRDVAIPEFTNLSYDPDFAGGLIPEGCTTLVFFTCDGVPEWKWLNLDAEDATGTTPQDGVPPYLYEGDVYIVYLVVTDIYGAQASYSRQVVYIEGDLEEIEDPEKVAPPYGEFKINSKAFLRGIDTALVITNTSYDLQGLPIASTFTLTKDGLPYPACDAVIVADCHNLADGSNDISALPEGDYVITLTVSNGVHASVPVAQSFSVIVDTTPPGVRAVAPGASGDFVGNTLVNLTFVDFGGSGFARQRIAVVTYPDGVGTECATEPAPDGSSGAWSTWSTSTSRGGSVRNAGVNCVYWQAEDRAGNANAGVFGPSHLTKKPISLAVAASPSSSITYGDGTVTLTATLTDEISLEQDPTGTVYFYRVQAGVAVLVGRAPIIDFEIATLTFTPGSEYMGDLTYRAEYLGDANYNSATDSVPFELLKAVAPSSISFTAPAGKQYDGDAVIADGAHVVFNPASAFELEWVGAAGTALEGPGAGTFYGPSGEPPAEAGDYLVRARSTDPGREAGYSGYEPVSISQSQPPVSVTGASVKDGEAELVTLTATLSKVGHGVTPTGTVSFARLAGGAQMLIDECLDVPLVEGVAECTFDGSAMGIKNTFVAIYDEDNNYSQNSSQTLVYASDYAHYADPYLPIIDPEMVSGGGKLIVTKLLNDGDTPYATNGQQQTGLSNTPVPGSTISICRVDDGYLSSLAEAYGVAAGDYTMMNSEWWRIIHHLSLAEGLTVPEPDCADYGSLVTGADGEAYFDDLPLGLYFVRELATAEGHLPFKPFLVPVPYTNETGDNWIYQVYVYPKSDYLRFQKDVFNPGDSPLLDANSFTTTGNPVMGARVGEPVAFRIVTDLPRAAADTTLTSYRIIDTLEPRLDWPPGFELDPEAGVEVAIRLNVPDGYDDPAQAVLAAGEHYAISLGDAEEEGDNRELTITFTATAIELFEQLLDAGLELEPAESYSIVVLFQAVPNQMGADAGPEGRILNTATLEYVVDDGEAQTIQSTAGVNLYGKIILKRSTDSNVTNLAGATFKLFLSLEDALAFATQAAGSEGLPLEFFTGESTPGIDWGVPVTEVTTGSNGVAVIAGLGTGTITSATCDSVPWDDTEPCEGDYVAGSYLPYWALEVQALPGHELLAEPFPIYLDSLIPSLTTPTVVNYNHDDGLDASEYTRVMNVPHNAGFDLPLTGAIGTVLFAAVGIGGLVIAVLAFERRAAKSARGTTWVVEDSPSANGLETTTSSRSAAA